MGSIKSMDLTNSGLSANIDLATIYPQQIQSRPPQSVLRCTDGVAQSHAHCVSTGLWHPSDNRSAIKSSSNLNIGRSQESPDYVRRRTFMKATIPLVKQYLLASDFDQTLSFNDSGLVLSELVGIPAKIFEAKVATLAMQNLVQQGGELSYLLLHDPEYRVERPQESTWCRRERVCG